MKIEYRKGNLLDTDVKYILHGCNAQGVMGSGVAAAIRAKYPKAYTDYRDTYDNYGLHLGDVYTSLQPDGKIICNAITQQNYGRDTRVVYVSYWAIANAFKMIEREGISEIAIPKLGAGLANGNWSVIEAIIENTLVNTKPIVYELE
jgi:O-acetyl-ADP-ribose deacetylase (regulator of RNase III)